jgi:predicted O-methyltransferase YrrM
MKRARGGTSVALHLFDRLFHSPQRYRRWANAWSRSDVPEQLVSLSGVYTNQAWPERVAALEALADARLKGSKFVALEIGTWFGAGSTSIWARHLTKGSQLFLVDSWAEYISDADKAKESAFGAMDSVHHVAINSALKRVYEFQRSTGGEIFLMRGKASRVCQYFRPGSVDFVYIDGSHYYDDVVEDIRLAKSLVRDGGMICGDDLEIEPTEARLALARKNLNRDFIASVDEEVSFHPGVLLAVYEHFPAVKSHAGIWSVERRGESWVPA